MKQKQANEIACPLRGPQAFEPCDAAEIAPLIEFLESGEEIKTEREFPRGTLLPDGRLDLCKQGLGPEGCRRLVDALSGNDQVKSLLLGTDGIGDEGAKSVSKLIAKNGNLEILYLGCNNITSEGVKALTDELAQNDKMRGLWLKRNPLGDRGVEQVAMMLTKNQSIRVLDLVHTGIGTRGLETLLNAIRLRGGIDRLYLSGNALSALDAESIKEKLAGQDVQALLLGTNRLGDSGALEIADFIRQTQRACDIGLASNGITDVGGLEILAAAEEVGLTGGLDLSHARSTKVLGAQSNRFGERFADGVAEFLRSNPPLRRLNIQGTGISQEDRSRILSAMSENEMLFALNLDGGLSEQVKRRLDSNRQNAGGRTFDEDVRLIRSVYR